MTRRSGEHDGECEKPTEPGSRDTTHRGIEVERHPPSPMEFSSLPLDPIYAWGIVLEPVETLIECTAEFIEHLARETYARGEPFSDDELAGCFMAFFDRLVEEGTLRRLPDAPPEMGRQILGPRRWLRAQQIRIQRLVAYWRERGEPTKQRPRS